MRSGRADVPGQITQPAAAFAVHRGCDRRTFARRRKAGPHGCRNPHALIPAGSQQSGARGRWRRAGWRLCHPRCEHGHGLRLPRATRQRPPAHGTPQVPQERWPAPESAPASRQKRLRPLRHSCLTCPVSHSARRSCCLIPPGGLIPFYAKSSRTCKSPRHRHPAEARRGASAARHCHDRGRITLRRHSHPASGGRAGGGRGETHLDPRPHRSLPRDGGIG